MRELDVDRGPTTLEASMSGKSNVLRYSIRDETLYGTISGTSFSMRAFSGGGRGSTAGIERTDLRHWNSQKKAPEEFDEKNRGGPLPKGLYLVRYYGIHETLKRCAALDQTLSSLLYADSDAPSGLAVTERDSFYIHGTGPKGSDGCIVPANKVDLKHLLDAIEKATQAIVLLVHGEGMNADRLEAAQALADKA